MMQPLPPDEDDDFVAPTKQRSAATTTTPTVLVLPSVAPSQDVAFLRSVFAAPSSSNGNSNASSSSCSGFQVQPVNETSCRLYWNEIYCWWLIVVQANQAGRAALVLGEEDSGGKMFLGAGDNKSVSQGKSSSNNGGYWKNVSIGTCVALELVLPASNARLLLLTSLAVAQASRELALYLSQTSECTSESESDSLQDAKQIVSETADGDRTKQLKSRVLLPLQVRLLGQNDEWNGDFCLNSLRPIPFETDLFKGRAFVIVRPLDPAQDDPYWNERIFAHKKRRFVLQIQGKFKRKPVGVLYAGAEISQPMQLGWLTKGLCNVLLKLVGKFQPKFHSSFGNHQEKAHIVVPAYRFLDRIEVTTPEYTPPPMEEIFDESPASLARRRQLTKTYFDDWNTRDVYSFAFFSMYMDVASWRLVNLPISRDIPLKTFWGESMLQVCLYDCAASTTSTTTTVSNTLKGPHTEDMKQYLFGLQLKYLGHETNDSEADDMEDDADLMRWSTRSLLSKRSVNSSADENDPDQSIDQSEKSVFRRISDNDDDDEEEVEYFFDAAEESTHLRDTNGDLGISFQEEEALKSPEQDRKEPVGHVLLRQIDHVCPGWIEIGASRSGYNKFYAVVRNGQLSLHRTSDCEDLVEKCNKWASQTVEDTFSFRMSSKERIRRTLGLIVSDEHASNAVDSFLKQQSQIDNSFLKRPAPSSIDSFPEARRACIKTFSFVARAISDRHWIEEWAIVSDQRISFYHPDKRKSQYHVPASTLMSVAKLSRDECPAFPNTFYLAVSTLGRTIYLMFANESKRNEWFETVHEIIQTNVASDNNSACSGESIAACAVWADLNNPAEEFLHKSTMWSCKNRRVLNCAKFSLQSKGVGNSLELVETALRLAVNVSSDSSSAHSDSVMRREFLCAAALLKDADVQSLPEDEKVVFFLNLYHVMIIHAYLVLGLPDSSFKWITYFNNIAYQVADDIFSLAELEHCIIRARMSNPSQFLSRFVIPKSLYRFALTRPDFRFNFALNCGSKSNPQSILIYDRNKLQEQLNVASRLYLSKSARVMPKSARAIVVTLPRVCQWFRDDFGGSDQAVLRRLEPFLPTRAKHVLATCWLSRERRFDMRCVDLRHLSYQFDCRPLKLYSKNGKGLEPKNG